jgi:hypothetical protein
MTLSRAPRRKVIGAHGGLKAGELGGADALKHLARRELLV